MIFEFNKKKYNLSSFIDISIPFHSGFGQVNAFYAPPFRVTPVKEGDFIGSTKLGGFLNFMNIQCNPHGNGTHTECVGHISKEEYYVNELITDFFYTAELISIYPTLLENGDKVIDKIHLEAMVSNESIDGLVIRTLPNDTNKLERNYSGSNPTYFTEEAMEYIVRLNIRHLLVDLPSVDREEDGGQLACHKLFWDYPTHPQTQKSITELVYIADYIKDGEYLIQNVISNIKLDAVPSRPLLYKEISI